MKKSKSGSMMAKEKQKLQNVLEDGLGRDLMNAGRFCFSCEQIFADRKCLEEHFCSSASYICSCGTEFAEYEDMQEHSTTHEPGHQVLDHGTIQQRRFEKRRAEEEQLKRLQTGEVVWKAPKLGSVPSLSLSGKPGLQVPIKSAQISQAPMQSALFSQVPKLYRSVSKPTLLPKPKPSEKDMQNIFAGVGAPTVDLWTLYQPVVLIQTVRKFNKSKPYTCGKCGQGFMTKTSLISHNSTHVIDKVSGCIGCGLLLSSKKLVPRFHACKAPNTASKFRIITARPLHLKMPNKAITDRSSSVLRPCATSSLQLKSQNPSAVRKGNLAPHMISTMPLKNAKIQTYNKSNQGLFVSPSLLVKNQYLSASNKTSLGRPVTSSMQLKIPAKSPRAILSKAMPTSSASNGFACRVCHLPFETAQLLQRHKCAKAREFMMAQNVQGGKQQHNIRRVTPMTSPNPGLMNGGRKLVVPASGNIKKNQVMAVGLGKIPGGVPVKGKTGVDTDADEDCYIVESGPNKPAEMIYQVTSSVPITT